MIATILIFIWIISAIKGERNLMGLNIIRISVFIVLLVMLLQPKLSWKDHYQIPLRWNIYADRSVSMGYHQTLAPESYVNNINSIFITAENKDPETENYYFDHKVYAIDDESFLLDGEATDLGKVIDHIEEEKGELAGAIIITDGQITKGDQNQSQLMDLSIPIYTIGVGDTIPLVDVAIHAIKAPTVIIKGEEMDIDVTLTSHGRINDRVNVLLYERKKLLASKYIQLQGDGSLANARFRITPQTLGENKYVVKASVLPEEININNNKQPFQVTILKDRYKVALITGSPNYNTGPLKKIIKDIPRIELDHFIQKDEQFEPSINEFWSTPYELIIFENFPIKPISKRWQQILAKKIASQKSSIFLFAGPNSDNISAKSLFPFFHVKNTQNTFAEHISRQWYWSSNKNILTYLITDIFNQDENIFPPLFPKIFIEPEETISTLAYYENSSVPLLVTAEVDGLRSGIWTSSDISTLYYKMTESEHDNISVSLINNLFSWFLRTSGENELYFRVNKDMFQQGEEIHIVGSHFENDAKDLSSMTGYITIINENSSSSTYELIFNPVNEQWETRFLAGKPGKFTYEIVLESENNNYSQNGSFYIDESQIELNQVSVNNNILENISAQTNGKYITWQSRAGIFSLIKPNYKQEIVVKDEFIGENYFTIILLIILLSIEWYIRRSIGLI